MSLDGCMSRMPFTTRSLWFFSATLTGSGRLCGGFHSACESRGHLSRNVLPFALSSASGRRAWKAGVSILTDCRDFRSASVAAGDIVTFPSTPGTCVAQVVLPFPLSSAGCLTYRSYSDQQHRRSPTKIPLIGNARRSAIVIVAF
jgi:hypothetical protein